MWEEKTIWVNFNTYVKPSQKAVMYKKRETNIRYGVTGQVISSPALRGLFSISIASMLLVFVLAAPALQFFAANTLIEVLAFYQLQ